MPWAAHLDSGAGSQPSHPQGTDPTRGRDTGLKSIRVSRGPVQRNQEEVGHQARTLRPVVQGRASDGSLEGHGLWMSLESWSRKRWGSHVCDLSGAVAGGAGAAGGVASVPHVEKCPQSTHRTEALRSGKDAGDRRREKTHDGNCSKKKTGKQG